MTPRAPGSQHRRFDIGPRYLMIFGTLALTWPPPAARADDVPPLLGPGMTIERQLDGGATDSYRIAPPRSGFWLVRVEQLGIDVVVEQDPELSGLVFSLFDEAGQPRDGYPGAQPMSDLLRQERAALVRRVLDELPTARDRSSGASISAKTTAM